MQTDAGALVRCDYYVAQNSIVSRRKRGLERLFCGILRTIIAIIMYYYVAYMGGEHHAD